MYFYPERRIGCASCDLVADAQQVIDEEELHELVCPTCGSQTLHHYPQVGSWPSDYPEPPCRRTPRA